MESAHEKPLPLAHPAMLVATLGGIGLSPKAPGTLGALVALPFGWLIARSAGAPGLVVAAALLFAVGWWAAAVVSRSLGKDPRAVVVDEASGQWLTLAAAPLDPWFYAAAFVLFRFFDIVKPWPVGWADRAIAGGFGTMIDDTLAALYAVIFLLLARWLLGR
jgi:phosphatidylglycerophosphatase A